MQYEVELNSLAATRHLAGIIAKVLVNNMVIALSGNLGSGKTTLVREVLRQMGVNGTIKSPTFTLVEPYEHPDGHIYHFDLYRFNDPEEWFYAGFDEYFNVDAICFIEWAEKAPTLIPKIDWLIMLAYTSPDKRQLTIKAQTDLGVQCLIQLINHAAT